LIWIKVAWARRQYLFHHTGRTKQMFAMFVGTIALIFILAATVGSGLKTRRPGA